MIKLLSARVSSHCFYPNDEVFLECTFEALEDSPIMESVDLFCDFVFGHMTIPASMAKSYRTATRIYPQPALWKKGDIVTTGTRWKIPGAVYGGSFGINIGICNADTVPLEFKAYGKQVKRQYIGDIEVAFGGCAPKFVNSHRNNLYFELENKKAINKNEPFKISAEIAEIQIRDRKNDEIITCMISGKNGHYESGYVSLDIVFDEKEKLVTVSLENVCEKDGYELLNIKFPTLVTRKNAQMITTFMGGRKTDSKKAYAWGYEQKYDHRNVTVLEADNSFNVVEAPYLDDKLHQSIFRLNGENFSSVGVTFTYRLRMYGDAESVKVINVPTLYIYNTDSMSDVLCYLRKDLKKKTNMYDRAIFYYFQIECDGFDEVRTFTDALQRVKELYYITGGVKQVMLLRGWQHEGHDTGYPDVFTVNKKAGTLDDLKYLIEEARKYNAIVTFHDNYDDMYEDNGYFDSEISAKDERGNNFKSWIWVSGISNMTSFPKLIKSGKLAERVKKTLDMYPVRDSYHLDVLSCEVKRYDFSPEIRMAAQETLEYKKKVIKEFEKYGFTITSEAVSQPFAGFIGHAWTIGYSPEWQKLFSFDEGYPLMPMIYHGFLGYSGLDDDASVVAGSVIVPQITGELGKYKEAYYLKTLPMGCLCNCTIDNYKYTDNEYFVTYSDGTLLILNKDSIIIKNKDRYFTKDGNTLVEGYREDEYIGYTKDGIFRMKKYFDEKIVEIKEIGENESEMQFVIKNEYICIDTNENTAFRIKVK